jgi:hypothetical protein
MASLDDPGIPANLYWMTVTSKSSTAVPVPTSSTTPFVRFPLTLHLSGTMESMVLIYCPLVLLIFTY